MLLPVHPFGLLFDLIERVARHLAAAGFPSFPLHFVSRSAKQSLHLANVQGEWYGGVYFAVLPLSPAISSLANPDLRTCPALL